MTKDIKIIRNVFSKYYKIAKLDVPSIQEREFGYGIEKKIDVRHLAFNSEEELKEFLSLNAPLYVSYSVAYYEFPKLRPMEKKNWKGSDLIFDLDIENESKYFSIKELEKIKEDTLRLIEEFLLNDFGIDEKYIRVNFSGNRGYHVHVYDERFWELEGEERKEIIEYIKGYGLEYEDLFETIDIGGIEKEIGPKPSDYGYSGRFAKKVVEMIKKDPTQISPIFKDEKLKGIFIKNIEKGNWSLRNRTKKLNKKLKEILNSLKIEGVNIDAAVTQDKKKLIRLPNSLHGSTGFIAKKMKINELEKFNPFKDAILKFKKDVIIEATEDIPEIEMDETFEKMKKGEEREVKTNIGIYFVLKGSAKFTEI